ncbi:alanine racemase [Thermotomaculum hydrothermale]|uniref:Alanine racemase n=1 Tax=Thermotomaculum hydrothermale TaxID=981385 RepID=A0A7R6PIQ3_9BACT|nr:alanine racemase [Thermotomaculum hydrothermale]BBB33339.1 alanine racemase [Thermotomaculum hydrothermale]
MKLTSSTIYLSKKAFLNNIRFLKSFAPNSKFFPVVKSNAYGHGLKEVVSIVDDYVDGYCVHSTDEALEINTNNPILILGHINKSEKELIEILKTKELYFTVYSEQTVDLLEKIAGKVNKKISLFVKVETGTHRLGLDEKDALSLAERIEKSNLLNFSGFSTHFANIEDTTDHSFAKKQMEIFNRVIGEFNQKGVYKHNACSAALMLFEETRTEIVRPGISFYGYYPSRETIVSLNSKGYNRKNGLKPALSWITKPLQIKKVKAGEYIGYGLTYRANRDMVIAVLPVGYSDGYDRGLSNNGFVLVEGKRCPVVGRVCMNLFMVDVTHVERVSVDDDVVLIGKSGEEEITADTLASLTGTINYEVIARLNPYIQKKIID